MGLSLRRPFWRHALVHARVGVMQRAFMPDASRAPHYQRVRLDPSCCPAAPSSVECELHSALHIICKFRAVCGTALLLLWPAEAVSESGRPASELSAKFRERVMGLFERLRAAEHQGRYAARERFTRARTSLEEAQSRLRRKMRIHPRSTKPRIPVFVALEEKNDSLASPPAIVTINGQDVPPGEPEVAEEEAA